MIFSSSSRDFWYEASSSALTYYIETGGNAVYFGKAVSTTGNARINVGRRVSDYLETGMPDFREYDGVVVPHPRQMRVFNLRDEDGNILDSYTVLLDSDGSWTGIYGPLTEPINGHADMRQKIFWGVLSENGGSFEIDGWVPLKILFNGDIPLIPSTGGSVTVAFSANTSFTIEETCEWLTVTKNGDRNGTLTFTGQENDYDERYCPVTFVQRDYIGAVCTKEGTSFSILVAQESAIPYFIVDPSFTIYGWDDMAVITARTNVSSYTITTSEDWITDSGHTVYLPDKFTELTLFTGFGDVLSSRIGTIYIWYEGEILASFTLTQLPLDMGGAIIGISQFSDASYLKGASRSGVTPDYSGVSFYGEVFTEAEPYYVNSGYVSTSSGLISHIGALGSEDDLYVGEAIGEMDQAARNWGRLSYLGGLYHTLIFPRKLKSISGNFLEQGSYTASKVRNDTFIRIPENIHFPDFEISGVDLHSDGLLLTNIYWNTDLGIPANFCFTSGSPSQGVLRYDASTLKYLHTEALSIGAYAFYESGLQVIDGLDNATLIGTRAFMGCALSSATIGSFVEIQEEAFRETTLPSNFNTIYGCSLSKGAFYEAIFTGGEVLDLSACTWDDEYSKGALARAVGFKTLNISGNSSPKMPGLFTTESSVERVYVDSSITSCSYSNGYSQSFYDMEGTFYGSHNLTYADLPGVTATSGSTFGYCENLVEVNVPLLERTLGYYYMPSEGLSPSGMFEECASLVSISLPSIKNISVGMFKNCSSLRSVSLGISLEEIGQYAFSGCTSLTEITYAGTMESFDSLTFLTGRYDSKDLESRVSWVFGSNIEKITCSNGVLHHTWNGDKPVLLSSFSGVTSEVFKHNKINFSNNIHSYSNLRSLEFIGNTSAETYVGSSRISSLTFRGDAFITFSSDTTANRTVEISFVSDGANPASVEILNLTRLGVTKMTFTGNFSSIIFRGDCLNYNYGLTEIVFSGTMAEWQNVRIYYVNWNRYSSLSKIVCSDGIISL